MSQRHRFGHALLERELSGLTRDALSEPLSVSSASSRKGTWTSDANSTVVDRLLDEAFSRMGPKGDWCATTAEGWRRVVKPCRGCRPHTLNRVGCGVGSSGDRSAVGTGETIAGDRQGKRPIGAQRDLRQLPSAQLQVDEKPASRRDRIRRARIGTQATAHCRTLLREWRAGHRFCGDGSFWLASA